MFKARNPSETLTSPGLIILPHTGQHTRKTMSIHCGPSCASFWTPTAERLNKSACVHLFYLMPPSFKMHGKNELLNRLDLLG